MFLLPVDPEERDKDVPIDGLLEPTADVGGGGGRGPEQQQQCGGWATDEAAGATATTGAQRPHPLHHHPHLLRRLQGHPHHHRHSLNIMTSLLVLTNYILLTRD